MLKQKNLLKCVRVGSIFLIIGLFLFCLYAIHDMQTAEGIGLYFSLKWKIDNRIYLDILVDVLSMAALAALIYIPCHMRKVRKPEAFLRLLSVYLAVVPQLSLTRILQLFRQHETVFLWDKAFGTALWEWICDIAPILQTYFPLLLILFALAKVNQCLYLEKRHKVFAAVLAVLLLLVLCFPSEKELLLYICGYLGVLLAFDCWENLLQANSRLERWFCIPTGLLLLRGIYRIIVLTSRF